MLMRAERRRHDAAPADATYAAMRASALAV